jgi:hypothetical protein
VLDGFKPTIVGCVPTKTLPDLHGGAVNTYYIAFRKWQPKRRTIRLEFVILANTKQEARTIAEKETAKLSGYHYQGVN